MQISSNELPALSAAAQSLEERINNSNAFSQFLEIVKESSRLYYFIATCLISNEHAEKERLISLCKKLSLIENEAMRKSSNLLINYRTNMIL